MMVAQFETPSRSLVLTGASGFIGRAFLRRIRDHHHVYALARRSQSEAGIDPHGNVEWLTVDITDRDRLRGIFDQIRSAGPVDYVVHLAGYYSFENVDEPEYEYTNVRGTQNVLECCRELAPSRFVFASSLVVSEFPREGEALTERSPPDASFPYARSKRRGEELTREFSSSFPCSIVRMAATFSDWCEYGPFYVLLMNWLGGRWNSRLLAGRGRTAQPFVHIDQLTAFLLELLRRSDDLPDFDIYTVASEETYSHRELFEIATRLCYGEASRPICVPKSLAALGIVLWDTLGRLIRRRPFERPWMIKYVDREIRADTSYTRSQVPVEEKPRLSLRRRFPYLLENMLSNPTEWRRRNVAILQRKSTPPYMIVAGILQARRAEFLEAILNGMQGAASRLPHYRALDRSALRRNVELIYDLLVSSIQHRDRMALLSYAPHLAVMRRRQGFPFPEVRSALTAAAELLQSKLESEPALAGHHQTLVDSLRLTMGMVVDEIEAVYESGAKISAADPTIESEIDDDWPVMRRRNFLQSVIDSIEDSIVIIDLSYRIRMMNRHARQLHLKDGLPPERPLCYELTHARGSPCSGQEHPCPLREVVRTGHAARVEHTHKDRDGNEFDVAILASPLRSDEQIVGIIETTHRLARRTVGSQ